MPTLAEMNYGIDNLEKVNNEVDYIVTHTTCKDIGNYLVWEFDEDELTRYFNFIKNNIEYVKWFFGHFHQDCRCEYNARCVYMDIIEI